MSCRTEYYMASSDRQSRLHVVQWAPEDNKVRALLQLAHGVTEHVGRYDAFARFMANRGIAVVGNSHRGHGLSARGDRERGFFTKKGGWDAVVADMRLLHDAAGARFPGRPYFLLGHSMGSFLARSFVIRYPHLLSGCAIVATGCPPAALLAAGRCAAAVRKGLRGAQTPWAGLQILCARAYNRRIPLRRRPGDWLTRNAEAVDQFLADDMCGFPLSAGLFSDLLGGIAFTGRRKNIAEMRRSLPVLLLAGAEDPVGNYGRDVLKLHNLFIGAGLKDVTLRLYRGARHEILNETMRQQVYEDVLRWINGHINGADPCGAPSGTN